MNYHSLNLYEILDIHPEASQAEIKKAFRRLAFRCHPDRNPGDAEAAKRFQLISLAYEILSNPQKKASYDRIYIKRYNGTGHRRRSCKFGLDDNIKVNIFHSDLTNSILADYFGIARTGNTLTKGMDLCFYLQVEQKTATEGGREAIFYSRLIFCDTCFGNGTIHKGNIEKCSACKGNGFREEQRELVVEIPPGTNDGDRLYFRCLGDQNFFGMPPGDLVVVIKVC